MRVGMANHGTFSSGAREGMIGTTGPAPGVLGDGTYATPRLTGFQQARMRRGKISVFALTFLSYVSFHCTRKIFSVIKGSVRLCWARTLARAVRNGSRPVRRVVTLVTLAAPVYVCAAVGAAVIGRAVVWWG